MESPMAVPMKLPTLLEDDGESLEAAFEFLNDWLGEFGSAARATDASAGNSATVAPAAYIPPDEESATPPKKFGASNPRRSTTDRRKDEFRRLLAEATELEQRAAILRVKAATSNGTLSRGAAPTNLGRLGSIEAVLAVCIGPKIPAQVQRVAVATLWKDMALRHKKLRRASEAENTNLRRLVSRQRKTIASLRGMLRRQTRENNLPKVVSVRSVSTPIGPNETHILDRLRLEVERQGLIMVASLNDWLSIPPISQICRVSPTTVTVMYVQHQVMPFYFKAVPTVLWETMKQSCMNCDQFFNERTIEQNELLLVRSHCVEHQVADMHVKLRGHTVALRIQDSKQDGFVFSSVTHPIEIDGKPITGITMREHGFATIANLDSASPTAAPCCQLMTQHHVEIEINPALLANGGASHVDTIARTYAAKQPEGFHEIVLQIESAILRHQAQLSTS